MKDAFLDILGHLLSDQLSSQEETQATLWRGSHGEEL